MYASLRVLISESSSGIEEIHHVASEWGTSSFSDNVPPSGLIKFRERIKFRPCSALEIEIW